MKKFLVKIIIVSIAGSLAGGSLFYFWKNKYVFSEDRILAGEDNNNAANGEFQGMEAEKKISKGRAEIIDYIEKNINKISPETPASGSIWQAVKIWFIDDKNFYADYKDGISNARRVLISKSNTGSVAEYKILGFFVPGKTGWTLKTGKDIGKTASFQLYEKNEDNNEWTVK